MAITPGAGKDTYDTTIDQGVYFYSTHSKTKGETLGEKFFSALRGAEDDSLMFSIYENRMSKENTKLLAEKTAPNSGSISYGTNVHNISGALDNLSDATAALGYRVFRGQRGYGTVVNQVAEAAGLDPIYKEKPQGLELGARAVNALTYGTMAAVTGVAAGLAAKRLGASSLTASSIVLSSAIAGAVGSIFGAVFTAPNLDDYGGKRFDTAMGFAARSVTTPYDTYADTGVGAAGYEQLLGALPAVLATGGVYASAAIINKVAKRNLVNPNALGEAILSSLPGGAAKKGLAPVLTFGLAAAVGAMVGATRIGTAAKYRGDAPERGKFVPGIYNSDDQVLREFSGARQPYAPKFQHEKAFVTIEKAAKQFSLVMSANLKSLQDNASGRTNQYNVGLYTDNPALVANDRKAMEYRLRNRERVKKGLPAEPAPKIPGVILGGPGTDSINEFTRLIRGSEEPLYLVFSYATSEKFFAQLREEAQNQRPIYILAQNPYGVKAGGNPVKSQEGLLSVGRAAKAAGNDNVHIFVNKEDTPFLIHGKMFAALRSFLNIGSNNFTDASEKDNEEWNKVTNNPQAINDAIADFYKQVNQDFIIELDFNDIDKRGKPGQRVLQSGKSQYDLGIFANLHRPNYSLKDSSTLTSVGAAQAARSTMPGIAYLPNKLSNQFFLDNRGQRPNLFQNWFYAMTGTAPSTDNFLGIGPSQAEVLEQADAQLSPFLSANPTKWGETRGVGVLFNEKVGGEFYVDGSGITGNLAKGLGRVLDIATGYYGLARLHELRTGQAPRDDIKLLHQQQGTSKPDRGFFESLLSETVDTVKATATSLLFYFGFSHALSLVQQHVETVGLNSVLNAITAPEGTARREQLKMLVSSPQLRVLQSAYTIKNAADSPQSLKMLSASFQSIFDTASMRAVEEVTGNKGIARSLVNAERVDELTSYLSNQARITPTNSTFSAGVYTDIAAMQSRISRLLKAEGITSSSAQVDVQAALQKVLATHLGYDQGAGTLSLDKPLFNDKLTFAERGGMSRLGSLRRIDGSNFRQALRPILESIALPRDQATFSGALDTFDQLISAQPSIQFVNDNAASPVQFINYGMERVKEVATQLDIIASDIPANPFLWSPAIRSALNITSLEVQQDNKDSSLKSFLGSGSFEAMIKTQKEIFRTVQNIASKGLFREIAQARAVFAISDSLAKQETMIAAKLAEDLSQTNVTTLQKLITNYSEERLEFTAAVKAGNRSLEPTDIQQSGYKRTRKLLMGMGAILVGDAVIDRYFLQNEGGDFFNQLQRFTIASQLVKDSESPYAGDERTEQERIYNTEFTGVVPRYLRAPIILAGAYAGGKLGFDVRYSDTLSNIKDTDIAKLDSLGDEVAKLKDLFTQSNKRLVTKFSNLGAYFGAMTAIMGTQLLFSTAAAAANTARTAWHSEGLKMQGEGAVASGKIAVALRNTLSEHKARAFAGQPNASESQVVNDLFTKDKATATRMAVATLMAEGIAKSQTEGMRPQYTFAHQIPNPIFQLAFVGKLDPKGETISIGAGFQFLPLLGAGSIPALPLSIRIKPNKDIRHLVAREIDYRDQEADTQGTGYFISRLFGQLTSSVVFDPNSQMNAVLGVAAGANIARFAAGKLAGKLQPNAELAEIYKGTKVVRDGAMFVADQSEKLMRWSQAPMLAAPNSAFKALMSVMASYDNDYPTLLTAIGPKARTATAFLLPLLFASASMSVGSAYDYIGSGIEALSGQTEDAEQSYAEGLNNARWYRAGGVISTAAIYGTSLYKFGAFKPAKSFKGGVNGTVLRQIYERGVAQGLSGMREAGGASTFLGSVPLFEQEVAAVPNVNADDLDARFAKRLVNEFEAQEQALKRVFDEAGVNQYAFLHKQTHESEAAIKAILRKQIRADDFDESSVFGRYMKDTFKDIKNRGTLFSDNVDVAYNRFKAQSKEAIKLAQKIEPSMYHTAPRRIGVIATAVAVPFVLLNIAGNLLGDTDAFVEKPSNGFLMGALKIPALLASGVAPEYRMSAEAKQKIASYRQGVGLAGKPQAPKSLGDTLLGLLDMINPVRIFNPVSPYKDDPKPFFNVIGPIGMSEGSRGWTHYTQVQSMAADASTSQYYMQAAVFQSADAAAIRAINKLDPQTDLDVINAWRAKQARQKPMSLKGTASRSESQAVSGQTPALAMALAQRQSMATWLSYQHADEIKNDFLMQMLYTGRVMNATVGNVPFKADYLGWTPFDAGLISEFIVGGTLGQPSDAAQKLQTFTSAVKGASNWLATGDFKDQFDYSLFNKTSNTQTQSPIPLIGTFIDLGRYVIGGMFDPQTKQINAVPAIAAMTAVTAFSASLALASAGSLYFAGSAVTAALAAYKEGGDYRNLTSNIKENIDQIAAKSLVARFDNTGEYGRLMLTNDRIMHTGGRVLHVFNQAPDIDGRAIASGVTNIIGQFNQDLAAIGMLNSDSLAAAVRSNNAAEVIDLVKQDLIKAFDKTLPTIDGQGMNLAQLLKFKKNTAFLNMTEYSGVFNKLETNLHTIFNSKMDDQLKIANAQELLTKSLLDIKQSTYRSSGDNDLNYKPSRYGKGHSTDPDLAFKSRLLYKETDYYAESLGELVSRYGAAGTLGRAALGVGSIAGSYLDVAQTWYPLLTATTALGADKRSDRVRAAQVLGSYTFETIASVGIARLLRKAPGKTIAGAIGIGVLAGIDKTLLKGEMWNTVQRFARVADQKLIRPIENIVTGAATFVSDIPLFRGIAKPLGIPFRALDPFINNLHQKAEGTGWANFTMFFLPHTVESRYNMSAQSSMGMETAFGTRPYEISSEETRQHQQQLADQRFNRAISVNKKPDEQLVSSELLGGQATLEAQIFYDKHLDNKGYLVDRVMSDFGPRSQLSSLMMVAASARAYEADYVDARRTREMLSTTSYGLAYAALETIHSLEAISKAKYGDPHKLFFRAAEESVLAVNDMILFQHQAKGIVRQGASDIFGRLTKLLPGRAGAVDKIASGNIMLSALPRLIGVGAVTAFTYYSLTDGDNEQVEKNAVGFTLLAGGASGVTSFLTSTTGKNLMLKGLAKTAGVKEWAAKNKVVDKAKGLSNKMPESLAWGALFGVMMSGNVHSGLNAVADLFSRPEDKEARKAKGEDAVPGGISLIASIVSFTGFMAATRAKYNYSETRKHLDNLKEFKTPKSVNTWVGRAVVGAFIGQYIGQGIAHGIAGATSFLNLTAAGAAPNTEQEKQNKGWFIAGMGGAGAVVTSGAFIKSKSLLEGINTVAHATLSLVKAPALWLKDGLSRLVAMMPDGSKAREVYDAANDFVVSSTDPNLKGGLLRNFRAGALKKLHHFYPQLKTAKKVLAPLAPILMHTGVDLFLTGASFMQVGKVDILSRQSEAHAAAKDALDQMINVASAGLLANAGLSSLGTTMALQSTLTPYLSEVWGDQFIDQELAGGKGFGVKEGLQTGLVVTTAGVTAIRGAQAYGVPVAKALADQAPFASTFLDAAALGFSQITQPIYRSKMTSPQAGRHYERVIRMQQEQVAGSLMMGAGLAAGARGLPFAAAGLFSFVYSATKTEEHKLIHAGLLTKEDYKGANTWRQNVGLFAGLLAAAGYAAITGGRGISQFTYISRLVTAAAVGADAGGNLGYDAYIAANKPKHEDDNPLDMFGGAFNSLLINVAIPLLIPTILKKTANQYGVVKKHTLNARTIAGYKKDTLVTEDVLSSIAKTIQDDMGVKPDEQIGLTPRVTVNPDSLTPDGTVSQAEPVTAPGRSFVKDGTVLTEYDKAGQFINVTPENLNRIDSLPLAYRTMLHEIVHHRNALAGATTSEQAYSRYQVRESLNALRSRIRQNTADSYTVMWRALESTLQGYKPEDLETLTKAGVGDAGRQKLVITVLDEISAAASDQRAGRTIQGFGNNKYDRFDTTEKVNDIKRLDELVSGNKSAGFISQILKEEGFSYQDILNDKIKVDVAKTGTKETTAIEVGKAPSVAESGLPKTVETMAAPDQTSQPAAPSRPAIAQPIVPTSSVIGNTAEVTRPTPTIAPPRPAPDSTTVIKEVNQLVSPTFSTVQPKPPEPKKFDDPIEVKAGSNQTDNLVELRQQLDGFTSQRESLSTRQAALTNEINSLNQQVEGLRQQGIGSDDFNKELQDLNKQKSIIQTEVNNLLLQSFDPTIYPDNYAEDIAKVDYEIYSYKSSKQFAADALRIDALSSSLYESAFERLNRSEKYLVKQHLTGLGVEGQYLSDLTLEGTYNRIAVAVGDINEYRYRSPHLPLEGRIGYIKKNLLNKLFGGKKAFEAQQQLQAYGLTYDNLLAPITQKQADLYGQTTDAEIADLLSRKSALEAQVSHPVDNSQRLTDQTQELNRLNQEISTRQQQLTNFNQLNSQLTTSQGQLSNVGQQLQTFDQSISDLNQRIHSIESVKPVEPTTPEPFKVTSSTQPTTSNVVASRVEPPAPITPINAVTSSSSSIDQTTQSALTTNQDVFGYRTAKGSVYQVDSQGRSVRYKMFRPEHGLAIQGMPQFGQQEPSPVILFTSKTSINILGGGQGPTQNAIFINPNQGQAVLVSHWADISKTTKSNLIDVSNIPSEGSYPLELYRSLDPASPLGSRIDGISQELWGSKPNNLIVADRSVKHAGNEVTEVFRTQADYEAAAALADAKNKIEIESYIRANPNDSNLSNQLVIKQLTSIGIDVDTLLQRSAAPTQPIVKPQPTVPSLENSFDKTRKVSAALERFELPNLQPLLDDIDSKIQIIELKELGYINPHRKVRNQLIQTNSEYAFLRLQRKSISSLVAQNEAININNEQLQILKAENITISQSLSELGLKRGHLKGLRRTLGRLMSSGITSENMREGRGDLNTQQGLRTIENSSLYQSYLEKSIASGVEALSPGEWFFRAIDAQQSVEQIKRGYTSLIEDNSLRLLTSFDVVSGLLERPYLQDNKWLLGLQQNYLNLLARFNIYQYQDPQAGSQLDFNYMQVVDTVQHASANDSVVKQVEKTGRGFYRKSGSKKITIRPVKVITVPAAPTTPINQVTSSSSVTVSNKRQSVEAPAPTQPIVKPQPTVEVSQGSVEPMQRAADEVKPTGNKQIIINEFSTGINAKGSKTNWHSSGFTGEYMNKTESQVPSVIQTQISNRTFSVGEGGSSNMPTLIGREVDGYSVLAVVTRGRDEWSRPFSATRFFYAQGEGNIGSLLSWWEESNKPTYNPFDTRAVGDSITYTEMGNNLTSTNIGEKVGATEILYADSPQEINVRAEVIASETGNKVSWAYQIQAASKPETFSIISPSDEQSGEAIKSELGKSSENLLADDLPSAQVFKKQIADASKFKLKFLPQYEEAFTSKTLTKSHWQDVFRDATDYLQINDDRAGRMLVARAIALPETSGELQQWITKYKKGKDIDAYLKQIDEADLSSAPAFRQAYQDFRSKFTSQLLNTAAPKSKRKGWFGRDNDGGFFKLTKGSGRGTKPVEIFSRLIKGIGSDIKSFFSNLVGLTEPEVGAPERAPRVRQPIGLDDIDLAVGLTNQPPRQLALPDYQPLLKPVSEAELQRGMSRQPRADVTAMDGAESIPNNLIYEEPLRPRYSVDATPEQFAHLQQSMSTTKMGGKTWIKPYAPKEVFQPTPTVEVKPSYLQAVDPWDSPAPQQLKPSTIVDAEAARLQNDIETLGSDIARLDKRSTSLNAAADNTDLKLAQALQQSSQSQYDSTVMTGYDYVDESARIPVSASVKAPIRLGVGGAVRTGFKTGVKAGLADIGIQASRSGVKFSGSQFKAGQLGKANVITTGLDAGVTVVEGALKGDSWGTTAKKAGMSLLTGLAFGAVMQGAVAGISAGLAAAGAAGAAAVFSTVIVPIAVVGLLAYGAYDTVTRLGKAYGDYKKKNKLSDADVRDNVVKGISDFFTGGEKQAERMPVAKAAVSKDLTAKYASKKAEAIKQSVAKNDFTVTSEKQPTKSESKGNLGIALAAGTVAGVAVGAGLVALGAPVIAAGMATAAVASLGATVAYQYGEKISGALSNVPIIGDIFFPKKASASDLSAMQSTAKKEQAKLDQMKSLNSRQRRRDDTFSEEYRVYEERVEKPESNAVTRFFGGIWKSIKEAGENLTSALFKTKKGIEREVINIAKWLRDGGIQRVLGMVGDAVGGAIDSITGGGNYAEFSNGSFKGPLGAMFNLLLKHESTQGVDPWDSLNPTTTATKVYGKHLKDTTIREMLNKRMRAAGLFQFITGTLKGTADRMGLSYDTKFTPEVQLKMAVNLIQHQAPTFWAWVHGKSNNEKKALTEWATIWAASPDPAKGGRSHYGGDGVNKALYSLEEQYAAAREARRRVMAGESIGSTLFDVAARSSGSTTSGVYGKTGNLNVGFKLPEGGEFGNKTVQLPGQGSVTITEGFFDNDSAHSLKKAGIQAIYSNNPNLLVVHGAGHYNIGLDYVVGGDGSVKSLTGGRVVNVVRSNRGYGNKVEIETNLTYNYGGTQRKLYTHYAHLANISVKKGDTINQGVSVGKMGSTGGSTGAHVDNTFWFLDDKGRKVFVSPNIIFGKDSDKYVNVTGAGAVTATQNNPVANMKLPNTSAKSTGKTLYGHKSYAETKEKKVSVSNGIQMGATAATQFNAMAAAAKKEGLNLVAISGFRSIAKQEELFNNKVARVRAANPKLTLEQAKKEAAKYVAPAGYSEHATGNAIDILNRANGQLTEDFAKTKEYAWLVKNAAKFGYTLSFPKNNAQGVAFEPWHWEYEGVKSSNQVAQQPAKQDKAVGTNLKNQLNQISVTALAPIVNMLFKGEGGIESINVIQRDSKGNRIAGRASTFQAEFGKSAGETTLAEIRARQQQKGVVKGKSEIGAVGFPQFIGNTLGKAMKTLGVSDNTKFTKEVQGQLLMTLLFVKRPEIGAYLTGQKGSSVKEAAQALAREFASVGLSYAEAPAQQLRESNSTVTADHERKRKKGQSLYEGVNANKAHITPEEAQRQLKAARDLVMKSLNGKQFVMPNIAFGEGGETANLAQQAADSYKDLSTVSESVGSPTSQLQQLIAGLSPYAADQLLRGNFSIPFIRSLSRQVRANLTLLMSNPGELIKKAFAGVGNAISAGVNAVKDAVGMGVKVGNAVNTGIKTIPDGGGAAYHIDFLIEAGVSDKDRVALMDSMANAYRSQGRRIEFSNAAVSGLVYNPDASFSDKLKLIKRVQDAHKVRGRAAMDFYVPKQGHSRHGSSSNNGAGVDYLIPIVEGGYYTIGKRGANGQRIQAYDKNGRKVYEYYHGAGATPGRYEFGNTQRQVEPPKQTTQKHNKLAPIPKAPEKTSEVIEKRQQEKVAQSMRKPETDNSAAMNAIASIKGQLPPEQADLIQQFLEQAEIVSDQKAREVTKAKATKVVVIQKPDDVADTNSGYKVAVQGKKNKVGATAQPVIVKSQDSDRTVYRYIHMESEAEVQYASINPYGGIDQNTMNAYSHNTSTESVPSTGSNQHGGYKEVG